MLIVQVSHVLNVGPLAVLAPLVNSAELLHAMRTRMLLASWLQSCQDERVNRDNCCLSSRVGLTPLMVQDVLCLLHRLPGTNQGYAQRRDQRGLQGLYNRLDVLIVML